MINNRLVKVKIVSFASGIDAYGQMRKGETAEEDAEMYITIYQQNNVDDIRYVDATHIGLTHSALTDANQVRLGDDTFEVMQVVPTSRWNRVLLKKV